jgi:hypothetical protein
MTMCRGLIHQAHLIVSEEQRSLPRYARNRLRNLNLNITSPNFYKG